MALSACSQRLKHRPDPRVAPKERPVPPHPFGIERGDALKRPTRLRAIVVDQATVIAAEKLAAAVITVRQHALEHDAAVVGAEWKVHRPRPEPRPLALALEQHGKRVAVALAARGVTQPARAVAEDREADGSHHVDSSRTRPSAVITSSASFRSSSDDRPSGNFTSAPLRSISISPPLVSRTSAMSSGRHRDDRSGSCPGSTRYERPPPSAVSMKRVRRFQFSNCSVTSARMSDAPEPTAMYTPITAAGGPVTSIAGVIVPDSDPPTRVAIAISAIPARNRSSSTRMIQFHGHRGARSRPSTTTGSPATADVLATGGFVIVVLDCSYTRSAACTIQFLRKPHRLAVIAAQVHLHLPAISEVQDDAAVGFGRNVDDVARGPSLEPFGTVNRVHAVRDRGAVHLDSDVAAALRQQLVRCDDRGAGGCRQVDAEP